MLYSIIGILVIIFDQLVKYWVDQNINYMNPSIDLIPNVLSLVRVQNDGAAFSFLQGGGARIWFIALTAVFAILVVIALATNFISGRFGRWCLVFITAGGLSNMIDRVRFGYVIDMFKINLFDFAVFNVADIFITVFCIAFILYILFGGEKEREPDADEFYEDDYEDERPARRSRSSRRAKDDFEEDEEEIVSPRRSRRADRAAAKNVEEEEEVSVRASRRQRKKDLPEEEAAIPASSSVKKDRKVRKAAMDDDEMFEEMFGTKIAPSISSTRKSAPAAVVAEKPVANRRPAPQSARKASASSENAAPVSRRQAAAPVKNADADPFAEWEKANAKVNAARRTSFEEDFSETSSQDAYSDFVAGSSGASGKTTAPEPAAAVQKKPTPGPSKPASAPAATSLDDDFDLESILNEFK